MLYNFLLINKLYYFCRTCSPRLTFSQDDRLVGEGEDIGDGLEGDLAINDVEALRQSRIVLAGLLPTLIGQGNAIT